MPDKMRTITSVFLFLFICPCFLPRVSHAGTVVGAGHEAPSFSESVKVRAWVETGKVVVTQQVRFIIEISTRTWFTRGTRVENIELSDAVVQQAGQFATNFTRHEEGLTWSVQQWTFFLYPLKEKAYRVPGVVVAASIADGKGQTLSGEVRTRPVPFRAVMPEVMRDREDWVATTRLAVREHYSVLTDKQDVGDAIERTIEIEADGLPAMMLPAFRCKAVPGLAMYEDPPRTIDDVNRGQRVGKRVEHITYLVERRGAYRIPARAYSWFNVNTGHAEEIKLPEKWLATPGFDAPSSPAEGPLRERPAPLRPLVLALGAGSFLFVVCMLFRRRKAKRASGSKPLEAALRRALKKAAKAGKDEDVIRILYQWLDHYGTPGEGPADWRQFLYSRGAREELECFNHCMSALYGPNTARKVPSRETFRKWAGLMDRRSLVHFHARKKPGFEKKDPIDELPLFYPDAPLTECPRSPEGTWRVPRNNPS
jgi:hypothetical protein